jgi:hypothetical protein
MALVQLLEPCQRALLTACGIGQGAADRHRQRVSLRFQAVDQPLRLSCRRRGHHGAVQTKTALELLPQLREHGLVMIHAEDMVAHQPPRSPSNEGSGYTTGCGRERLAFHRTRSKPANQVPLQHEKQGHHRR